MQTGKSTRGRLVKAAASALGLAAGAWPAAGLVSSRPIEIPSTVPFRTGDQPAISPVISHNTDADAGTAGVAGDGEGTVRVVNQVRRADGSAYGWVILRPIGWGAWGWTSTPYGRGRDARSWPPPRYRDAEPPAGRWRGWGAAGDAGGAAGSGRAGNNPFAPRAFVNPGLSTARPFTR